MKKYRLKKDTPALKAGMFFELKDGRLFLRESEDCVAIPVFQRDGVNDFDEWFEEVKEFEEWKPEKADFYKILRRGRGIPNQVVWQDSYEDNFLLSIGNAYPLDTPDEVIIKEQKLIPQALHRLKIEAKKAWFEFDGSNGPDWKNGSQRKYNIYYSHAGGGTCLDSTWSAQEMMGVYFPTEESAQTYIDNHLDDLKLLFGVE